MHKYLASLSMLLLATGSFAQSFNGPESVEWDPVNNGWLVANPASGQLLSCDAQGNILSVFATPGSPYGTEVLHDTVYVNANDDIRGYNLHDGTEVLHVDINGQFLNGLTSDGDRYLFATDFGADKIYRIDVQTGNYNEFVASTDVQPNGIAYDGPNNRLVYVEWGSSAEIRAVSLADSTESLLASTSFSNIDGITQDDNGKWYVTPWTPASLQQFNNDFSGGPTQVLSGLSGPADIDFSSSIDSVAVPNSFSNSLDFFHAPDTMVNTSVAEVKHPEMLVWPVPANAFTRVALLHPAGKNASVQLIDVQGRVVLEDAVAAGTEKLRLNLEPIPAGTYVLRVADAQGIRASETISVQH